MQLARDPAELTSAATDLLLAALAAAGAFRSRRPLWRPIFSGLGLVSLLGAAVHGLALAPGTLQTIWIVLNLAFGLTVSLFALAAVRDRAGAAVARQAAAPLVILGLLVGGLAQAFPATFLPFVVFNACVLIGVGLSAAFLSQWPLAAGCLIALVAGTFQATGWRLVLIWEFDHNGLFHLVQMPALLLWIRGARGQPPT